MEKDRLNKLEEIERRLKEAKKKLKLANLKSKLESAKRRLGKAKKSTKTKPQDSFWHNIVENLLKTLGKKTPPHDGISKDGLILSADDFRMPGESLVLYGSLSLALLLFCFISLITLFIFPILIAFSALMVKAKQGQLLGQSIKVSEHQLLDVYNAAKIAAKRLLMKMPDVFVRQDPYINAFALGFFGNKSVVLHSKTVEALTENELIHILGHEFSHIKCNHTNWIVVAGSVQDLKIPIISGMMGFILLKWLRMAEYTADRGGLLASKNIDASVHSLAKIAVGEELYKELNIDKMFGQKDDIDSVANVAEILGTHPYLINRIHALKDFYGSEIYTKYSQI